MVFAQTPLEWLCVDTSGQRASQKFMQFSARFFVQHVSLSCALIALHQQQANFQIVDGLLGMRSRIKQGRLQTTLKPTCKLHFQHPLITALQMLSLCSQMQQLQSTTLPISSLLLMLLLQLLQNPVLQRSLRHLQ